jgi:hypothetical protein
LIASAEAKSTLDLISSFNDLNDNTALEIIYKTLELSLSNIIEKK